jgi:hypothetical protein
MVVLLAGQPMPLSAIDKRREQYSEISSPGMDGMCAAVDASATREHGIPGGIVARHLNAQAGSRLKTRTAGGSPDLNRDDFMGMQRLALQVGSSAVAVGQVQPPPGNIVVGKEVDLPACGVEPAQQDKEIQTVSLRDGGPTTQASYFQ